MSADLPDFEIKTTAANRQFRSDQYSSNIAGLTTADFKPMDELGRWMPLSFGPYLSFSILIRLAEIPIPPVLLFDGRLGRSAIPALP